VTHSEFNSNQKLKEPRFVWLRHQFYHRIVGKLLPVSWFAPRTPSALELSDFPRPEQALTIQIVSHCWNYAHLLRFQLTSLYQNECNNAQIIYTLYYCPEDQATVKLIHQFKNKTIKNLEWDFRALPREKLFRRAIGRNEASLGTHADWMFFVDCDLILNAGCLNSVADTLAHKKLKLAFPAYENVTDLLPSEHPLLNQNPLNDGTLLIDTKLFKPVSIEKPKGGYQFVHGDVARVAGYCGSISLYQRPSRVWRKTFEDTTFRTLIQDSGTPVDIKGIYRIRHQEKGRYKKDSFLGRLRKTLRKITD